MFQINIEARPNRTSKDFKKYKGALVVSFIDYKDAEGAFLLAKHYIEENDWSIIEIEEEYYQIDSKADMEEDYKKYYEEVLEYGFSMIYNAYEN